MSHTVLICDDAIFMRTMVGDILQQAGFEIVGEAETGVQAVEKYKQLRPDLVTMDIVMPDMGGIDAVREITKFDPNAKVSIEPFKDIIGRHFKQPKEGLGFDASPTSHMWRTIMWPTKYL